MTDKIHERRHMSDEDVDRISKTIIDHLGCKNSEGCPLTKDEVMALKNIVHMKKSSVKIIVYIIAALVGLAVKDIYLFIISHIGWVSK